MATSAPNNMQRIRAQILVGLDGDDEPQLVIPMTCLVNGREHAVTELELAFGSGAHGRYRALCGEWVLPGSLLSPPGRACAACVARVVSKPIVKAASLRRVAALLAARRSKPGTNREFDR